MNYTIRKSKLEDLKGVEDAHRRSIQEICSKDYSPEQIETWGTVNYSQDIWKNSINNEYHLVVEVDGIIEGMCHSAVHEDGRGEIKGLYFSPVIAGKGIGREIFEMSMEYLIEKGCRDFFISATKTALGFYETMGFEIKSEPVLNIRGVDIEAYYMEKSL